MLSLWWWFPVAVAVAALLPLWWGARRLLDDAAALQRSGAQLAAVRPLVAAVRSEIADLAATSAGPRGDGQRPAPDLGPR
ncbi:MAG TPA: hypothetical protein VHT75_20095 [Acidimicrobiales bacterium]|jgi:hypothetical protein|nr:hypothetical protein [Acidimicrobiales bacterium]